MRDFRKYRIWQDAVTITNNVYSITENFPTKEIYGLSNQLQRAAVSIASNIAEGASRSSSIEFAHFLEIAIGSAFEVETQLTIASQRNYISQETFQKIISLIQEEEKGINTFIQTLKPTANS
ncbi:MAG: four helix bundle protein [Paludibacteraceae bacterium]|nr:four helix bundle protein [Paludibacteraceae bacterium]